MSTSATIWARLVAVSVMLAAMGMPAGALRADTEAIPGEPPEGAVEEGAPGEHVKPDKKVEEEKRDKADPMDVRNLLDNVPLIRDLRKVERPAKKGIWQELLARPYLEQVPLVKAERLVFHGQYKDAERLYDKLLAGELKAEERVTALVGRAEAILRQGRSADRERFAEAVEKLPAEAQGTAKVVMLRAEALLTEGKVDEARELLKSFSDKQKKLPMDGEVLAAVNMYAGVLEQGAYYPAAVVEFERVAGLAMEELPEDPAVHLAVADAIHRHAVLTASLKDRVKNVQARLQAIEQMDGTYWPAKLALAKLFLGAHNAKDGGAAINEVLNLNPNSGEARALAMAWGIGTYNFEAARTQLTELRELTDAAEVDAMEGRLILKERLPDQAIKPLLEAVKKHPKLPEARGWLAAAYLLNSDPHKADEQLSAMRGPDGGFHPVVLYEAAEVLRDARQFKTAEKLYVQSRDGASWWSEPPTGLGELYLEVGNNDAAKQALDKAFSLDPFNMRALNHLRLLDIMHEQFKTLETANFIIRYTAEDQILAELAAQYLEGIHPEICGYFEHTPEVKTIIEFFPTHEQFGVRTTGLPWIGTVGACTGNVIAMDVPRGGAKNMMGAFDWARVLRHEYVHTVTLSMTENRIPHWLTEAAAVHQEDAPRDWDNAQLLASNYRAGTLFRIKNLNWGFIRPKKSTDRQLAYMQSQWLYEYLTEAYGHQKVLAFLRAFRDGKIEAQAYPAVFGKDMDAINDEFLVWAGKQVEKWGLPSDPLPKLADAERAVKEKPEDVEAKCTLAWVLLTSRNRANLVRAEKLLEEAVKQDGKQARAGELLGVVQNLLGKKDAAKKTLEGVVEQDGKRAVALRTLALLAMQGKRYDEAEKWFERLQAVLPLDDASYRNLAGLYLLKGDKDKAIAQLRVLQAHEQKDERIARRLAQLLKEKGELKDAAAMAFKAIRINPYNALNHHLMAQLLDKQEKSKEAVTYWAYAAELQPKVPDFWSGLADARGALGDKAGAAEAAKKAVELDPNAGAKKWLGQ